MESRSDGEGIALMLVGSPFFRPVSSGAWPAVEESSWQRTETEQFIFYLLLPLPIVPHLSLLR